MVAPVGNSATISPLGQQWKQIDLSPMPAPNPGAAGMDIQDTFGEPKKKGSLLKKALIGLAGAAGIYLGAKHGGKRISPDSKAFGWLRKVSDGIADNVDKAFNKVKTMFKGKAEEGKEAAKDGAGDVAKKGSESPTKSSDIPGFLQSAEEKLASKKS